MNDSDIQRAQKGLGQVVQQHENVYGVLEVDIQKRIRSVPRPGSRT